MSGNNYYKVYQDFTPVVLTKKKTFQSTASQQSKSNIHVDITPFNI